MYVNTEEQVVDIFKNTLRTQKLHEFRCLLGVLELDLSLRESVEISSSTSHMTPRGIVIYVIGMAGCGLGSQYGPCTHGLEILDIPVVHI